MAGTGKSTIARTVARDLHSQGRLAANFFFSKGRGDLGLATKLFSTIAIQLANVSPMLRAYLCEAIVENPTVVRQVSLLEQYDKLILRPMRMLRDSGRQVYPLVIVLDALDECGNQDDIRLILRLLSSTKDLTTLKLRILLTSRPETPIRLGFRDMDSILHQDLILQDVAQSVIQHDIYLFLRYELEQIRKRRDLGADWPDERHLQVLVEKADGLFIFAATACRFIDGASYVSAEKRLSELVLNQTTSQLSTRYLDTMYLQVLQESVTGEYTAEEEEEVSEQFRHIVGSIVILYDTLSVTALSSLLFGPSRGAIRPLLGVLSSLHSVLNVPEDLSQPVRLLHPSFHDFLRDECRCHDERFWVCSQTVHHQLAEHCLGTMARHLHKNICELPSPAFLALDVEDDAISCHIPADLQYACLYWVNHVREGRYDLAENGIIHMFLQTHLLHWLETLSLIKRTSNGVSMIIELESMLTVSNGPKISPQIIVDYTNHRASLTAKAVWELLFEMPNVSFSKTGIYSSRHRCNYTVRPSYLCLQTSYSEICSCTSLLSGLRICQHPTMIGDHVCRLLKAIRALLTP